MRVTSWGGVRSPSMVVFLLLACSGELAPSPPGGAAEGASATPRANLAGRPSDEPATAGELVRLFGPRHGSWLAERALDAARRTPLAPLAPTAARSAASSLTLPEHAHEPFRLRDARSQLGIGVSLSGARAVPRRALGALSVYAGGAGEGATLVLSSSERGVEDFITFDTAPAAPVEYRVELEPGVAGLRLVARTLEFLDASGTPRLRVAPPYLIGADGRVARAELAVSGCAVDESPALPWGRAPVAPGASECSVSVSWDDAGVAYPALLDPVWTLTGSMSQPRQRFASLRLDTGRVLVAGGLTGASSAPCASAEIYDPATETWSLVGSLGSARSDFTLSPFAGALAGNEAASAAGTVATNLALADGGTPSGGTVVALAAGGNGATGPSSSVELFDAAAGTWSAGPSLPIPYAGHSALRLDDGSVLVAGGSTASVTTALLAPGAASWSESGELFAEEPASTLTLLDDGAALLVGPNTPSIQRYFPDEGVWRPWGEPMLARAGHSATRLLDGRVLLVGGSGSQSAELFDPSSASSRFVGSTYEPRTSHTATLLADGRVAVVGGEGVSGASGTEIYDPEWGTWSPGPGTSQGRAHHQSVLLADGSVLAIGGAAPDGLALATAQRLNAARPPTVISEYQLPARLDRDVTSAAITELWAAIIRPATLEDGRRYPLLVFLHGNHGTCGTGENPRSDFDCTYTSQGFCPEGFVVTPNHRGYDYVATELAARGFIVVSVNANRGITCGDGEEGDFGFNLARGRLLLEHLRQLSEWDRGLSEPPESVGVSLLGKLDFSQLGMMGHSRGGEGVRAAYEQYRDANSPWPARIVEPVVFRGLFEIGPVDGQTSRVLNADSTAWNVLLPMCDGDVSDLEGVRPFDRMLGLSSEQRETPKSTIVAWGTNHNYFNSEWQESDSPGCTDHRALFESGPGITGSAEQRQIGLRSMLGFFLANVGAQRNPSLEQQFDPSSPLATSTRIDRGFTPSLRPNRGITLEDFSGPSGQSAHGLPMLLQNLEVSHTSVPEHDGRLGATRVTWPGAAADPGASERVLQLPFSALPAGLDLTGYTHLELRAGRAQGEDLLEPTPLGVQLVNADGSLSERLDTAAYGLRLDGPVGGPYNTHVVLQTVRLPLTAFGNASRNAVRGVRFTFTSAAGAELFIASVRASLGSGNLSPVQATRGPSLPGTSPGAAGDLTELTPAEVSQVIPGERPPLVRQLSVEGNSVIALRAAENRLVELELLTREPFRAQDDQLLLELGDVQSTRSRHPDGALSRVIFTLEAPAFAAARDGEPIVVRYASNDARRWEFGALQKSLLQP
jgi:Kelch motif protein/galactose oxidase-like protein